MGSSSDLESRAQALDLDRSGLAGIPALTLTVCLGASHFTSLKFSFLICKLGLITVVSSQGGYQD